MAQHRFEQLLDQVAFRMRLASIAQHGYMGFLVTAGVYAVGLIAYRLLDPQANPFTFRTLPLVPIMGLLAGLIFFQRVDRVQAARLTDRQAQTKDLFLTAVSLAHSVGAYQPMVLEQAGEKAKTMAPAQIRPFGSRHQITTAVVVLAALAAMIWWMPAMDILGKQKHHQKMAQRQERLKQTQVAVAHRIKALKKQNLQAPLSPQVQARINELKKTLRRMNPHTPNANRNKLIAQKARLAQTWKQSQRSRTKRTTDAGQRLGAMASPASRQWEKQLAQGSTQSLQKKLQQTRHMADQLSREKDPGKRRQLSRRIRQSLQEIGDFAAQQKGQSELSDAINKSLQQLDMANMKNLSKQATQGMKQAMKLAQMELKQMAQNSRDAQAIKDAMKTLQMAQKLNGQKQLDGQQARGAQTMKDYQKLYQQQIAKQKGRQGNNNGRGKSNGKGQRRKQGQGNKPGMAPGGRQSPGSGLGLGGPGRGQGGIAPEDNTIQTDFIQRKEHSQYNAGKILLNWKAQGIAPTGHAKEDYQQSLKTIRQHASEAIETEQIPPGYHNDIKHYFDTFDKSPVPGSPLPHTPGSTPTPENASGPEKGAFSSSEKDAQKK